MIWKDATGAIVPFFLQFGFGGSAWTDLQGGLFADGNGIIWALLPWSQDQQIVPAFAQYNDVPMTKYWDGQNCTGTPYVPYAHARFAFTLYEQTGNTIRALKDNASVSMQFMQSSYAGQSCSNNIVHVLVAPLSDAPIVTPPTQLPFTLPLHPEIVP